MNVCKQKEYKHFLSNAILDWNKRFVPKNPEKNHPLILPLQEVLDSFTQAKHVHDLTILLRLIILFARRWINLIFIYSICKDIVTLGFSPRTYILWNALWHECFPDHYNLTLFKSNVNKFLSCLSIKSSHLTNSIFTHNRPHSPGYDDEQHQARGCFIGTLEILRSVEPTRNFCSSQVPLDLGGSTC